MTGDPNYAALLKLLPTLQKWVDATGEVTLTDEEAERIRSLGFPDAKAGRYKLPPFPYELVADTMFEYLSMGWDNRQAWSNSRRTAAPPATPQARLETREVPSESLGSGKVHHANEEAGGAPVKTVPLASRVELEAPLLDLPFITPSVVAPLRLAPEVRDHPRPEPPAEEKTSDIEEAREAEEARKAEVVLVARKILKAVQKEGGQLAKRRAQQRLSRHKGIFNEALRELVARGLVVLEGAMIVQVSRVMQARSGAARASPEKRGNLCSSSQQTQCEETTCPVTSPFPPHC